MKKKKWNKLVSVLLAMVTAVSLLSGCGGERGGKKERKGEKKEREGGGRVVRVKK